MRHLLGSLVLFCSLISPIAQADHFEAGFRSPFRLNYRPDLCTCDPHDQWQQPWAVWEDPKPRRHRITRDAFDQDLSQRTDLPIIGCTPCTRRSLELALGAPAGKTVVAQVLIGGEYYLAKLDTARVNRAFFVFAESGPGGHSFLVFHFDRDNEIELYPSRIGQPLPPRGDRIRDLAISVEGVQALAFRGADGKFPPQPDPHLINPAVALASISTPRTLALLYRALDWRTAAEEWAKSKLHPFEIDLEATGMNLLLYQTLKEAARDGGIRKYNLMDTNCTTVPFEFIRDAKLVAEGKPITPPKGPDVFVEIGELELRKKKTMLPRDAEKNLRKMKILKGVLPKATANTVFEDAPARTH